MSQAFVCILIATSVVVVSALALPADLAKAEYCKIGDVYIKEKESGAAPIGQCVTITCLDARANTHMGKGCGLMHPGPGCRMAKRDLTKPYPDCCPRVICNELTS